MRPPGVSQYSADEASTRRSTMPGSSGPSGNQASSVELHSSFTLAWSATSAAVPVRETQLSFELSVTPVKGNAVFFSYDRPHPMTRSLHGGAPVIEGEKWVATKWLRERRFE